MSSQLYGWIMTCRYQAYHDHLHQQCLYALEGYLSNFILLHLHYFVFV